MIIDQLSTLSAISGETCASRVMISGNTRKPASTATYCRALTTITDTGGTSATPESRRARFRVISTEEASRCLPSQVDMYDSSGLTHWRHWLGRRLSQGACPGGGA